MRRNTSWFCPTFEELFLAQTDLMACFCDKKILPSTYFLFHRREKSYILIPLMRNQNPIVSKKISSFFPILREKCVTPKNEIVECTRNQSNFFSLLQNLSSHIRNLNLSSIVFSFISRHKIISHRYWTSLESVHKWSNIVFW